MVRRQTQSRMEKFVDQDKNTVPGGTGNYTTSFQIDGGEVEAQVKRIMLSLAESVNKECTFKLGLFQFQPAATDFNQDEAIVLSGAIGNQFAHNLSGIPDLLNRTSSRNWIIKFSAISNSVNIRR